MVSTVTSKSFQCGLISMVSELSLLCNISTKCRIHSFIFLNPSDGFKSPGLSHSILVWKGNIYKDMVLVLVFFSFYSIYVTTVTCISPKDDIPLIKGPFHSHKLQNWSEQSACEQRSKLRY